MSKNKVVTISNTKAKMKTQTPIESRSAQQGRAAKAARNKAEQEEERRKEIERKAAIDRAKAEAGGNWHSALVPALDALIGDPSIIEPEKSTKLKAEIMYIPEQYIDRVCDFRDELSSRGEAAKSLLRSFSRILEEIHKNPSDSERKSRCYECKNYMKICFVGDIDVPRGADRKSATVNCLAVANHYNQQPNSNVAILTGDDFMAAKALKNNIDVARINPDVYTGRRKLVFPKSKVNELDQWLHQGHLSEEQFKSLFPDQPPLRLNEFVEFEIDDKEIVSRLTNGKDRGAWNRIGRFYSVVIGTDEDGKPIKEDPCLQSLHYIRDLPDYLKPRNSGQAMFAEALLAPPEEIPIVICPSAFGTGKTYLATGIGLYLLELERYMRIFVVPRDSELGKEIGFLPGTEFEKTLAKAMPIVDNIFSYLKNKIASKSGLIPPKGKKGKDNDFAAPQPQEGGKIGLAALKEWVQKIVDRRFELVSVINMGGRNISDSWVIYDEAQDLERFQMNQLMKRIGDGSKMVIIGDPHQVFNRHMNERSNGLSYAATKMAGSPYAAVISMLESEITRSVAAQEIARRLDHVA
ncbi:PhoH family protein [Candidatus Saccharibacteria bacterium]|nr:PhoH family protein [Candidatus Saccharibacteria bacterium]MBR6961287.1 PhoH family protein [Candidatus Saccharibacteria bacterium]